MTSAALAAPQITYEYTGNGSSIACARNMTEREYDQLWIRTMQELEFAGYRRQEGPNPDTSEFTNGFYYLLITKEDAGFCAIYRDAYQPQIPALHRGE
ncbi:MAG: hypothetical protein JJ902_04090 [Roseibium sp.]|nr:hypothetical protein [Roseibium sp.]